MLWSLGSYFQSEHGLVAGVGEGGDVLYGDVLDSQLLHGLVQQGAGQPQAQDVTARQLAHLNTAQLRTKGCLQKNLKKN